MGTLKGHTVIELENVETGEKRVIEDDNLVTIGPQLYLQAAADIGVKSKFMQGGSSGFDKFSDISSNSQMQGVSFLEKNVCHLFGGLLLFDSQLDEDETLIYPPSGINVTGMGSLVSYSGKNLMAGSLNASESGETDEGYKLVWDFSTTQANGSIGCACLVPAATGKVGFGSYDIDVEGYFLRKSSLPYVADTELFQTIEYLSYAPRTIPALNYIFSSNQSSSPQYYLLPRGIFGFNSEKDYFQCFGDYEEMVQHYSSDQKFYDSIFYKKKITLRKVKLNLKSFDIFDNHTLKSGASIYTYNPESSNSTYKKFGLQQEKAKQSQVLEEVEVEMPLVIKNKITESHLNTKNKYWSAVPSFDNEYLYIVIINPNTLSSASRISANEEFYVWRIRKSDYLSEGFIVTNTTGEKLLLDEAYPLIGNPNQYSYQNANKRFLVCKNKLFVVSETKRLFCIDIVDNTDVFPLVFDVSGKEPRDEKAEFSSSSSYPSYYLSFYYANRLFFSFNYSNNETYVFDFETKKIRYVNFGRLTNASFVYGDTSTGGDSDFLSSDDSGRPLFIAKSQHGGRFSNDLGLICAPWFLSTINNLPSPVIKTSSETMKVTYTLTKNYEEGGAEQ